MFGPFDFTPDPRDTEETPSMHPEPAPASKPKYGVPEFKVVTKEYARHCYICGYGTVEYAQYPSYQVFLHYGCWSAALFREPAGAARGALL